MMADASAQPARSVGYWFEHMPLTSRHWQAGGALLGVFIFDSWEMVVLILNSASVAADFGMNTSGVGRLIGALFLGMIPGVLLWGRLSDVFGRKRSLVLSLLLYAPIPLLSAVAPSAEVLWWLRLLGGVLLSGAIVITFPWFVELLPVRTRGRAAVYLSAGWPVGILIAVGLTAALMPAGWRAVIACSAVSGLWALVVHRLVPESPYWLAGRGRCAEADRVIGALSAGSVVAHSAPSARSGTGTASFLALFRMPVTRVTLLQTTVNFCFSWGYWGLNSWLPELLARRGLSAPEGLGFIAVSTLFMFPGYICASYLTGRYGRKRVMLTFVFAATVAGFAFAYSQTIAQMYLWNFTLSFFSLGAWGVWSTWLGEIYDTQLRSVGVAWGVSMQRIANAIAPIAIGALLVTGSFLQTVSFISAFLAASFIATLFLPETEGRVLH